MDISEYASEWLNAENISVDKENPTKATILDAGVEVESKYGKKPVFNIKIGGQKVKYRPSKTALKTLMKRYTSDTTQWIGKEIDMIAVDMAFSEGLKKVVVVL